MVIYMNILVYIYMNAYVYMYMYICIHIYVHIYNVYMQLTTCDSYVLDRQIDMYGLCMPVH